MHEPLAFGHAPSAVPFALRIFLIVLNKTFITLSHLRSGLFITTAKSSPNSTAIVIELLKGSAERNSSHQIFFSIS